MLPTGCVAHGQKLSGQIRQADWSSTRCESLVSACDDDEKLWFMLLIVHCVLKHQGKFMSFIFLLLAWFEFSHTTQRSVFELSFVSTVRNERTCRMKHQWLESFWLFLCIVVRITPNPLFQIQVKKNFVESCLHLGSVSYLFHDNISTLKTNMFWEFSGSYTGCISRYFLLLSRPEIRKKFSKSDKSLFLAEQVTPQSHCLMKLG